MKEDKGWSLSFIYVMDSLTVHIHPSALRCEYFMAEKSGSHGVLRITAWISEAYGALDTSSDQLPDRVSESPWP